MELVKTRKNEEISLNTTLNLAPQDQNREAVSPRIADMPSLRPETKDCLKQLHANLNALEDLSGRLGFVLADVRTLIRR